MTLLAAIEAKPIPTWAEMKSNHRRLRAGGFIRRTAFRPVLVKEEPAIVPPSEMELWIADVVKGREIANYKADNLPLYTNTTHVQLMIDVARKHGITVDQMKAHTRVHKGTSAKTEFCGRASVELGASLNQIKGWLCMNDHTSARYHIQKYKREMEASNG